MTTKEKRNAYMKAYYLANPEKRKDHDRKAYKKFKANYIANAARWRKANPEKYRAIVKATVTPEKTRKYQLKYRYNLTESDYAFLLQKQSGACAICHTVPSYRLSVDHNHSTGQVRALLCQKCNLAVGFIEQPGLVTQVESYLSAFH